MKLPKPKKGRPVRCHFCGKQMYYFGDKRCVPEVSVEVIDELDDRKSWDFYAHSSCFYAVIKR